MPVYNGSCFVEKAIESILNQTYERFEFIIIDDASTDSTWGILERFARRDKRVRLLQNDRRVGISESMKKAIRKARGSFLARMDADDIAYTRRLKKQVAYLTRHPETVAVGGQCAVVNEKGTIIGRKTFPTQYQDVYRYIFRLVPLQQPTLMINRRRLPKTFSFYVDGQDTAEELELLFKLFRYGKVENLSDTVLKYRLHEHNTSLQSIKKTFRQTVQSRFKAVTRHGYQPSLAGVAVTLLEALLVSILPEAILRELFFYLRGLKRVRLPKIRLPARLPRLPLAYR